MNAKTSMTSILGNPNTKILGLESTDTTKKMMMKRRTLSTPKTHGMKTKTEMRQRIKSSVLFSSVTSWSGLLSYSAAALPAALVDLVCIPPSKERRNKRRQSTKPSRRLSKEFVRLT